MTRGLTAEEVARLDAMPPRTSNRFRGGMLEVMGRFMSWSDERHRLTAERARIPDGLALAVVEAAELDLAAARRPLPTTLWS